MGTAEVGRWRWQRRKRQAEMPETVMAVSVVVAVAAMGVVAVTGVVVATTVTADAMKGTAAVATREGAAAAERTDRRERLQ